MRFTTLLLCWSAVANAAVIYSQRDARFFGETSGRETLDSGTYTPSVNDDLTVDFPANGPATFHGVASVQGTPFRLEVENTINAASPESLTFNTDFITPTSFVSLVQSRITDTNIVITGGSGVAFFLPTFRVVGSFSDSHSSAVSSIVICAGVFTCPVTGLANSTGPATVDLLYTPAIGTSSDFVFGTPFSYFFFLSGGVSSTVDGTLNPGSVGVLAGLELVGYQVVDANGVTISGLTVESEFFNPAAPVPEPGSLLLVLSGFTVLGLAKRHGSARHRGQPTLQRD